MSSKEKEQGWGGNNEVGFKNLHLGVDCQFPKSLPEKPVDQAMLFIRTLPVLMISQYAKLSQGSYSILGPGLGDFKVSFSRRGVLGISGHTEAQILKRDLT